MKGSCLARLALAMEVNDMPDDFAANVFDNFCKMYKDHDLNDNDSVNTDNLEEQFKYYGHGSRSKDQQTEIEAKELSEEQTEDELETAFLKEIEAKELSEEQTEDELETAFLKEIEDRKKRQEKRAQLILDSTKNENIEIVPEPIITDEPKKSERLVSKAKSLEEIFG